MGSRGLVKFKAILEMLKDCAPGFDVQEKLHFRWILYGGKTYHEFPKHSDVPVGHLKKMIRFLEINLDCAKKHLELLRH
jgi:hypothetical protein